MTATRPRVAVVTADGAMPPGLAAVGEWADLHLARTQDEFNDRLADSEILLVYDFRTRFLHDADWSRAGDVRWIHAASAGVDAVLAPQAIARDISVTNSRGVFDAAIAEYVLALALMVVKDLRLTVQLQEKGQWRHRDTAMLRGKRMLVVGAGSIGSTIGRLAHAAGMAVEGIARSRRDEPPFERVGSSEDLIDALGRADFVCIAAPLTPQTRGMFDSTVLRAMRPGSWLINVGRGPIVDETALLHALDEGHLGGAALDVFMQEPLPRDHPFWSMDNVVISPHMSGDFIGWVEALSEMFIENLKRYRAGEPLNNLVDKAAAASVLNQAASP